MSFLKKKLAMIRLKFDSRPTSFKSIRLTRVLSCKEIIDIIETEKKTGNKVTEDFNKNVTPVTPQPASSTTSTSTNSTTPASGTEKKKRKVYSEEFRTGALSVLEENNGNLAATARQLGVSKTSLASWRDKGRKASGEGQKNRERKDGWKEEMDRERKDGWMEEMEM